MKIIVILSAFLSAAFLQAADTPRPLAVGDAIPDVTLRTEEDREVKLRTLVAVKPTVLIFYRDRIDLEAASGRTHHLLPHPAVFVADTGGTIRFAHVNPDYKVRLEPKSILEAAKAAVR